MQPAPGLSKQTTPKPLLPPAEMLIEEPLDEAPLALPLVCELINEDGLSDEEALVEGETPTRLDEA